jgi:glutamate formiminotransferase/formiminotetrahydrofolate cyclodeaminase
LYCVFNYQSRSTTFILYSMVEKENPNSVTDAGEGALCVRTAIYGAYLNVKINARGLKDKVIAEKLVA